jgi:hypothetical protein
MTSQVLRPLLVFTEDRKRRMATVSHLPLSRTKTCLLKAVITGEWPSLPSWQKQNHETFQNQNDPHCSARETRGAESHTSASFSLSRSFYSKQTPSDLFSSRPVFELDQYLATDTHLHQMKNTVQFLWRK